MIKKSVGANPERSDGPAKVTGEALYLDDLQFEGWRGVTLRSPHARARIKELDVSAARALPDVFVVTAADLPGPNVIQLLTDDWPILADEFVNHVGEAVALVAAPNLKKAEAAAAAISVVYEELKPVLSLDEALEGDPRCGGALNVQAEIGIDHGNTDAAWAEADHIIEGTYECGHQEHIYIEPNGMAASWDEKGHLEVFGSMQCPYYMHKALMGVFGLEHDELNIRQTVTGGGFGGKEDFPDMIGAHVALLARASSKPVKILYEREEDIIATTKRHPARVHHKTGVMSDGTLVASEIEVMFDGGAYTTLSPVVLSRGVIHAAGAYQCPNVRIHGRVLATNTATNGAFRGFGAPQTLYAVERQMDRVARVLGMSPLDLREKNAFRVGDTTATGQILTRSVSAMECMNAAIERSDYVNKWNQYEAERKAGRADDGMPLKGIGLSLFWHGSGFTGNGERVMKCVASVRPRSDGRVDVLASSTDIGQGTETIFAQIVSDVLGVEDHHICVPPPETAKVPDSGPTVASRTVMVVGAVLTRAAERLKEALEAEVGADYAKDFGASVKAYVQSKGETELSGQFEPREDDAGFDEKTYQGDAYSCYGWGCDVVEVEVDPDTFAVRPIKVTTAVDVGKAIHPILCRGQIEGGTLQAVAWGYLEEIKLKDGHYMNNRLTSYIIPTSMDAPLFDTIIVENPANEGPFGAKGVGEIPMDGGAPAVVAAIENAVGIVVSQIPATPERLFMDFSAGKMVDAS